MTNIIENKTPKDLGYRMPAEWEKQTAVWLQWPGKYPNIDDQKDLTYQMKMEKNLVANELGNP